MTDSIDYRRATLEDLLAVCELGQMLNLRLFEMGKSLPSAQDRPDPRLQFIPRAGTPLAA